MEKIAEGAEAQILKIDEDTLKKIRLSKKYRLKEIDLKLRKFRNRREFKILLKLHEKNLNVPEPFKITEKEEISFTFEYIKGKVLKEALDKKLLFKAFEQIIKMHKTGIIHGDLTTLNMIEKENKIYLIDFGLAEFSTRIEDKAVDLNLFFTCIKNEHPAYYKYKEKLLKKYKNEFESGENILKRLEKIEHRGRNK